MSAAERNTDLCYAWVTLGSNIDPMRNLPCVIQGLSGLGTVTAVSSVWESEPVGDVHQPRFCNAAVELETRLPAVELKRRMRQLEEEQGRVRDPLNKNGPRSIDLDLALYCDGVSGEMQLHDTDLAVRNFLAVPLAEIAPHRIHPVLGCDMRTLAEQAGGAFGLQLRPDIPLTAAVVNQPQQ